MINLLLTTSCASRAYDVENHKDGTFRNQQGHSDKSFWSYLWMRLKTRQQQWPESVSLSVPQARPMPRSEELRIYYINHSTFLIQKDNMNILTDPVFGERVSPVSWAGPKRVIPPGVRLEDLPKIDVIIISHDHYDHLDIQTLRNIARRDQPEILLGLGAGRVFDGEKHREMAWGDEWYQNDVRFVFTPAQHFSGRGLFDRNTTLWGSFVIEFRNLKIYFGGDTGYGPHFSEIRSRYGAMDVSLLPIGAYDPKYFMEYHHMDPEQAYQSYKDLESRSALGMHWGTFQLTNESRTEPRERLQKVAAEKRDAGFVVPENGQCFQWDGSALKICSQ